MKRNVKYRPSGLAQNAQKGRRAGALVFLTVLALFAAACGSSDDSTDAATTTAPEETTSEETTPEESTPEESEESTAAPTETVDVNVAFSHGVLFDVRAADAIAEAQGFYTDEGIQINRQFPGGGADGIQALVSGGPDVAVGVGVFAAYSAIQQEAPVAIASAQMQGYTDLIYYVASDSDIQSFDDIGGSSVAISRPGASTDLVCRQMIKNFEDNGEAANSCEVIGGPPDIFTAVSTGQVDVGWTVPPFFQDDFAAGTIRRIGSGDDVEGVSGTTARVNLVSETALADKDAGVAGFFTAYERAVEWIDQNQEEALAIWAETAEVEVTEATFDLMYEAYPNAAFDLQVLNGLEFSLEAAEELEFLDAPLSEDTVRAVSVIDELFQ